MAFARRTPARVRSVTSVAAASGSRSDRSTVARRRKTCASCSHVNPIPPCTCMCRLAHRSAAGPARVAAIAAVYARWSPPVDAARGVPDRRGRELGGDGHVGAVVLDRLVHRDRATELLAHLGVLGGGLGALPCDADGLGGEEEPREIDEHRTCTCEDRRGRAVERDTAGTARRVEVRGDVDLHAAARHVDASQIDDQDVVARRHDDQVGEAGSEDRARVARRGAVTDLDGATETDPGAARPVGEAGEESTLRVLVAGRLEQRAGDDRRHERARGERAAELLDHDDELLHPRSRTAVRLAHVEAEPAEAGDVVPEVGARLVRGFEERARGAAGVALAEEVGRGVGEGPMVVSDGNRHTAGDRTGVPETVRRPPIGGASSGKQCPWVRST